MATKKTTDLAVNIDGQGLRVIPTPPFKTRHNRRLQARNG